jgi:hypothetical protein
MSRIDDVTMAMFEFENGAVGHLGTSVRVPFRCTTAVYGSAGAGHSLADGTRFLLQDRDSREPVEIPVESVNGVTENIRAFCDAVAPVTARRPAVRRRSRWSPFWRP